ncbi:aldehyde ferredoxin oxidoreductase N-terminal domain-containing protein [Chloroflexota bacterium]
MAELYGYAGKILVADLSSGCLDTLPTSYYAAEFVGGRGIAARIYWDEVQPDVGAFDPQNCLIFMTGPLAGVKGLSGSRWEVSGKSPATDPEQFCYCNLGGHWGVRLKFAGYDGVVVKGRAESLCYLLITDASVEVRDAAHLRGRGAIEVRQMLKSELGDSVSVVACGPAGENMVSIANLLADNDASGASGFGAVMGSKNLKAIVAVGSGEVVVADPDSLRGLIQYVSKLKKDVVPPGIGLASGLKLKSEHCFGCPGGCLRAVYESSDGKRGKFMCQSGLFYLELAHRYYGERNEVPFYANKLCDERGLDTGALQPLIMWLARCYRAGILNDDNSGVPLSKLGSLEFMESLTQKVSRREGFGDVLSRGVLKAAESTGSGSEELITDYVMKTAYPPHDPRLYITTALLYAMEPRPTPTLFTQMMGALANWLEGANDIIEDAYVSGDAIRGIAKRFFGSELAADFSTYDGKPLAAKNIQDRDSVEGSLILCSFAWPITHVRHSEDHVGDPTIESKLLSAVTGRKIEEGELNRAGEVIYNLKRAILAGEGHRGREYDVLPDYCFDKPAKPYSPYNPGCLVPGKDGEVISRNGAVLDRGEFERMKDEYYGLRGWDITTGLQTKGKLEELGLHNIAAEMDRRGLLA